MACWNSSLLYNTDHGVYRNAYKGHINGHVIGRNFGIFPLCSQVGGLGDIELWSYDLIWKKAYMKRSNQLLIIRFNIETSFNIGKKSHTM